MTDTTVTAAPAKASGAFYVERVTHVHHWTDELFTLRTTRDPALRFASGQFVMLGLREGGKPLVRAYSVVSPYYADELEFFSIKVQDGPLTSRLQHVQVGDEVLVGKKPTGTLVLDGLKPGKNLYMLGTGTGLAPFLSLARDPDTYERYEKVVVTHTVRRTVDLAYRHFLEEGLPGDPDLGEMVAPKLIYYPSVTRDAFVHQGRAAGQQFERHGNGGTFYDITDQNRQTAISEANDYCKGLGMTAQIHFVTAPSGGGVSETALVFVCK
jgi:ferredoxin--NADP+ reductase